MSLYSSWTLRNNWAPFCFSSVSLCDIVQWEWSSYPGRYYREWDEGKLFIGINSRLAVVREFRELSKHSPDFPRSMARVEEFRDCPDRNSSSSRRFADSLRRPRFLCSTLEVRVLLREKLARHLRRGVLTFRDNWHQFWSHTFCPPPGRRFFDSWDRSCFQPTRERGLRRYFVGARLPNSLFPWMCCTEWDRTPKELHWHCDSTSGPSNEIVPGQLCPKPEALFSRPRD